MQHEAGDDFFQKYYYTSRPWRGMNIYYANQGGMNMQIWEVLQSAGSEKGFNKEQVLQYLHQLSKKEFDIFCRTILHLTHFYDSNKMTFSSDDKAFIEQHKEKFYQLLKFNPVELVGSERE